MTKSSTQSLQNYFNSGSPHIYIQTKAPNLILQSEFRVDSNCCRLTLYPQILLLNFLQSKNCQQSSQFWIALDFELNLQVIPEKQTDSSSKLLGFVLHKKDGVAVTFYQEDQNIIAQWVQQLSSLISLRNFSLYYQATKYLGRGEFAQVWQVQRLQDKKKFASKIVDKDQCFGQVNGKQALYNEISILRSLDHPNLAKLHTVYETDKNIYLVMDLMEGPTLSEYFKTRSQGSPSLQTQSLGKSTIVKLMKKLLEALKYLKEKGIIHRDIKPGNLILDQSMQNIAIIDFGLSQKTDKSKFLFQLCGSPGYMAPQILKNTSNSCHYYQKCDIFSLGAVFYYILTGQPLIQGQNTEEILKKNQNIQKCLSTKLKKLSNKECELLKSMLVQDPERRATIDQLIQHKFFKEFNLQQLQCIRNAASSAGEQNNKVFSIKANRCNSRFEELFSESLVFCDEVLSQCQPLHEEFTVPSSKEQKQNLSALNSSGSGKHRFRARRFMSQQILDVDFQSQSVNNWSGNYKNLKTLEDIIKNNVWSSKDTNKKSQAY